MATVSVGTATATATDNCSSTVTGMRSDGRPLTDPYPLGVTMITWTASDAAGNMATCTQTVTVIDTTPPIITCPANTNLVAGANCTATVNQLATATDNCDASVTITSTPSLPTAFGVGMHVVTFTATDDAGNTASCTTTVTVTNTPPTASAGADQTVDERAGVTLTSSGNDPDPGQPLSFQWTQTGGPPVTLNGANTSTATFTAPSMAEATCGVLTFELKVTDPCGAMATDTVVVNVSDVFVLQDNRNDNCLRLNACTGIYTFRTNNNETFTGPVVITRSGTTLNFESGPGDPNTLGGSANLTRRTGTAGLRVSVARRLTIDDSNIDNNGPCP